MGTEGRQRGSEEKRKLAIGFVALPREKSYNGRRQLFPIVVPALGSRFLAWGLVATVGYAALDCMMPFGL